MRSPMVRITVGLAAVALGIASVVAHAREYAGIERYSKDFALDYSSAKAVLNGDDPYAPIRVLVGKYLDPPEEVLRRNILPGANWHTPFKLIVTLPFAALPYRAAGVLWLLVSAAAFVAAGALLGLELGWSRLSSFVLGFAFLGSPVVQIDLSAGQLNGPMLLLIVLTWRSLRRDRSLAGGVALGVLVALKFFPAFLALPFVAARRLKPVTIAAATAVVLTVAGAVVLGVDHTKSFLEAGRGSEGFSYWDASPANISWWGFATRWLTPNGWVDAGIDATAVGLTLGILGIVACCAAAAFSRSSMQEDPLIAALPLMLLAWPIVWEHYLALTLPWVVLVIREVIRRQNSVLLLGSGVVALLLILGFPPGGAPLDRASDIEIAVRYQLPTIALIGAALLDRLPARRDRRRSPAGAAAA